MPKTNFSKKNTLKYEDPNGEFMLVFAHKNLAKVPKYLKDEFKEAIERFGSLIVENIENMDKYKEKGYTEVSGIVTTIKKLREANKEEDEMSEIK